jgi:uncharacterized protein (DUF1501 family)
MGEVTLRYVGPAYRVRVPAADIEVQPGETVSVAADATIAVPDEDGTTDRPLDAWLIARHDFERVAPDATAVLEESIPDLEAALATGECDAHLDALAHAEREGGNRVGALDAIHDRQAEVE